MLGQSAAPACPAERPVDDIIAEIHKQQSKKKHHVSSPLPNDICIFAWCRSRSQQQTPPTPPKAAPPANSSSGNQSPSSSKPQADSCDEAMEKALQAAHDVEVGDEYFEEKNYNAALERYQGAGEEKPGDPAIHVRLGRALEKLDQIPQAIEQYQAAQQMAESGKWLDEAKAAVGRLQQH
ncbi:MAG TPA: tetratricopeptide repeat protein [Candidatus Angelobacter sp.]|nr:tetratricopeptide repeat protein [Candidatus Angelobacter sp.]